MTPYRTARLSPPPALSWWSTVRARVRGWYWRRFGTVDDWQRAEVREALGGAWEQVWPYFGRVLLPWERIRGEPSYEIEWRPVQPDDAAVRHLGRWRPKPAG